MYHYYSCQKLGGIDDKNQRSSKYPRGFLRGFLGVRISIVIHSYPLFSSTIYLDLPYLYLLLSKHQLYPQSCQLRHPLRLFPPCVDFHAFLLRILPLINLNGPKIIAPVIPSVFRPWMLHENCQTKSEGSYSFMQVPSLCPCQIQSKFVNETTQVLKGVQTMTQPHHGKLANHSSSPPSIRIRDAAARSRIGFPQHATRLSAAVGRCSPDAAVLTDKVND